MNVSRTALLPFMAALCLNAEAAFPTLYLKNVCDDQLHAPTNICNAGDGSKRLFICDQPGKIFIFQDGMLLPTPFLDLTTTGSNKIIPAPAAPAYSERGLLGMCFHPGFSDPMSPGYGRFYINYNAPATHPTLNPVLPGATTNCVTVIAEYQVSATNSNLADPNSERILLTYGQPQSNHNGGQMEFGPDGYLYIGSGDGGGANDNALGHTGGTTTTSPGRVSGTMGNGQDVTNLWGKILRIDPLGTNGQSGEYGIPPGNHFFNGVEAHGDDPEREEIYAWGLRNPWKFSFDAGFGGANSLICADVGQLDVEEIDLIVSGGNYGWRIKEGTADFDDTAPAGPGALVPPIAQYTHPSPTLLPATPIFGTSITGGYVYRGSAIPSMVGKYLFADYAVNGIGGGNGVLLGLEETSPGVFDLTQVSTFAPLPAASRIYCFGVDEAGELYVGTKITSGVLTQDGGKPAGTVWKIQTGGTATVTIYPSKDNTIYEGLANSNGKLGHIFSGKTGDHGNNPVAFADRRALMRFDVSSLPTGATLTAASLELTITKQVGDGGNMALHRLTADWGEGNSNSGEPGGNGTAALTNDATWIRRFYNTLSWATPGGDYSPTPSATRFVGSFVPNPKYTWSSPQLLADVQAWFDATASNFGWILIGDEVTPYSAQRFASRENATINDRPKLLVSYSTLPPLTHFESFIAAHYSHLAPGTYVDPAGDTDGDNIANLLEYASGSSPAAANAESTLQISTSISGDTGDYVTTITFRRDPRATDLTYELEASYDNSQWDLIATSTAGGAATGTAVDSDTAISGQAPLRLVTAKEFHQPGSGLEFRRLVRLRVTRTL